MATDAHIHYFNKKKYIISNPSKIAFIPDEWCTILALGGPGIKTLRPHILQNKYKMWLSFIP